MTWATWGQGVAVVMVDDDPDILVLFEMAAKRGGHTVLPATQQTKLPRRTIRPACGRRERVELAH